MTKQDLKIVFFGTPEFAVASLAKLVDGGYNVAAVVTMPDKPAGRGKHLMQSDVKRYAVEKGLPVLQPERLKADDFVNELRAIDADLFIVIAFRMLPEVVWQMPRLGTFNLHASLLPKYRGAAPIQRAIMAGEKEMGITLMYMEEGLDTGDMIAKSSYFPDANDNFGAIHDKLAHMGAELLLRTLPDIFAGKAPREQQDDALSSYAAKIEKEDTKIDFHAAAEEVHNKIRALSPEPAAYAFLGSNALKITKAETTDIPCEGEAGLVVALDAKKDGAIFVNCADRQIKLLRLIPEGKKEMSAGDFIRGRKIEAGQRLD